MEEKPDTKAPQAPDGEAKKTPGASPGAAPARRNRRDRVKEPAAIAAPVVTTAPPKPARPTKPGHVIKYGCWFPEGTPMLAVELYCYRMNVTVQEGGLGAEQHFKNAWKIQWPTYEWSDWVEMMVYAWCKYKWISIIGCERASKTFTHAHIAWLDYQANPFETLTSLTTVTFEGLKLRMWSDVLRASATSRIQQPFQIRSSTNEMRVYPKQVSKEAGEKYQIHGMAVNHTKDAEGRIRGGHAPRRRIFLDEAQDIAPSIYEAMINPMSAPDAKCVMLSNPVEKVSKFGDWCEPAGGWSAVHDTDEFWETKKGGFCIHLDGLQSPNIVHFPRVFTGIINQPTIDEVKRIHGEDSVQWWALVRGWFPPDGLVSRIFPSQVIEKMKPPIIFDYATEACATLDPAFEEDACAIHFGAKGKLRDGRMAISATETHHLRFKLGPLEEPKDYQVKTQVMALCAARGVKPKNFIMDRSGSGRGAFALLVKEWSPEINGIDYGGKATERPLRSDESEKCCDIFQYFVTELWLRARAAGEEGIVGGLANLDPRTIEDLYSRRYEMKKATQGTVVVAEQKSEMKKRLGRSPDDGDAFVQFAELLIREGHGPGRKKGPAASGSKWQRQRSRAIAAGKRYAEKQEFSHH